MSPGDAVIASDFETFLQMLTTQARYQDPLEPIDSSEYAAQLAQFSMVEQQVQSNQSLALIAQALGGADLSAYSGWVGMEARAGSSGYFGGSPVSVFPKIHADADSAIMIVRDETNQELQRIPLSVTTDIFQWTGTTASGTSFPLGQYRFSVESYRDGELISETAAEVYGRIEEARVEDGTVVLILEGGERILTSDVTGLRNGP